MIPAAGTLLSAAQLRAVADQWKRERRVLETSFAGVSMLPAIAPGQSVTLECGVDARIGEVAVFVLDNQVGVHRIAARWADMLLPWGDANALPDDPIALERVIGTLRGIAPRQPSLAQMLLLRWFDPARNDTERLRRRVRRLHHYREILAGGPAAITAHIRDALRRRLART